MRMENARLKCITANLVIIVLFLSFCTCLTPQCRNEKGEAVDWFYVYKLPRERNHLNPLIRRGVAYMHLTPSKLRGGWIMSDLSIGDPLSMVGRTLAPLYHDKNTISLVYNDQPPATEYQPDLLHSVAAMYSKTKKGQMKRSGAKNYKKFKLGDSYYDDYDLAEMCKMHSKFMKNRVESGHTKGVILGDKFTSLWLVHSVPRFPPVPNMHGLNVSSYSYPTTGMKFGQSFLCVSVQTSTLNQIATQLKYNEPLIAYYHIPPEFDSELPNLVDVVKNKTIDVSPWYHIESFETLVGRKFLSFAKSAMFNDDLYSGLVAEVLQSDLLVESWTNGPGTLDSECNRNFQVRNIDRLKFPIAKMSFTSHHDHSKWAVAVAHKMHNSQDTKVADYWVCVGDINRASFCDLLLLADRNITNDSVRIITFVFLNKFLLTLSTYSQGWGYINLHCRDNDNSPVDWWYIYKPASDVVPFFKLGHNFTFITPASLGRWEVSDKYITSNSMLQHTLAPIFRPTYADYLAIAIYEKRNGHKRFAGSVARGIIMADELGGVWIYHTVPNLVDLKHDHPSFPEEESSNGHLIMCLSLDLSALNAVVHILRNVYPKVTYLKIPEKVQHLLPEWKFFEMPLMGRKFKTQEFVTRGSSLRVEVLVRRPGDNQSVYQKFARSKNIVLDVYGQSHSDHITSICRKNYSVRNIEKISLKLPEEVFYLRNKTDRMWFAVSTAAHWQQQGAGPPQYWSCISNMDKEDKRWGGDLVCVENYRIWHTFDNLKVTEPKC